MAVAPVALTTSLERVSLSRPQIVLPMAGYISYTSPAAGAPPLALVMTVPLLV